MKYINSMPRILILLVILFSVNFFLQTHAFAQEECIACHKVRHGDNRCIICHLNASIDSGKHVLKPDVPTSVHDGFDWEGDGANETNLPRNQESCPACHVNLKEHASQIINSCEGCHVEGKYLESSTIILRNDIINLTPRIYSHYSNSTINVPPQGDRVSSCFGFNSSTGEGSCHGVDFNYRNRSGGYFAFNFNYSYVAIRSDIYHWTASVDSLPETGDCTFCHKQEDDVIRKAWGNARPLPMDSSHLDAKNKDCFDCHVEGQFKSFHGKEIVKLAKKSSTEIYLVGSLLLLTVIIIILWRKQRNF